MTRERYLPRIYLIFFIPIICLSAISDTTIQNFRLENLEGETVSYSDLKGEKLTVIDFWATWCKPCRSAIPKLVKIYKRFRDRGVRFIGISVDSPRNTAKVGPVANSLGIEYPVLLDVNGRVMSQLNVDAVPSLFIVDKNDKVVSFHRGYRPGDEVALEKEISDLLKESTESANDSK